LGTINKIIDVSMTASNIVAIALVLGSLLAVVLTWALLKEIMNNRKPVRSGRRRQAWKPSTTPQTQLGWAIFGILSLAVYLNNPGRPPALIQQNLTPSELPAFTAQGQIPGPYARVEIRNSVPYPMDVLFQQGDKTQRLTIPKCDRCQIYNDHPPQCPTEGVADRIELEPGTYQVTIAWQGNSNPYYGQAQFGAGTAYNECFTVGYGRKNT
jgi:hypothetical protein